MRRRERPPILDYLVFGTAAVLAVIVGYYALVKQPWRHPAGPLPEGSAGQSSPETQAPAAYGAPAENTLEGSGTRAIAGETPGVKSPGRAAAKKKR
jgi:hypothetical protein